MPRSYPDFPIPAVAAVIWRGDDVLLVKRANPPRQGEWTLPGGVQDLGETVEQAISREVREETGVEIAIRGVAEIYDLIDRDQDGLIRHHYTILDLTAEWISGEAVKGDDAADIVWAGPDAWAKLVDADTLRVIGKSRAQRT